MMIMIMRLIKFQELCAIIRKKQQIKIVIIKKIIKKIKIIIKII